MYKYVVRATLIAASLCAFSANAEPRPVSLTFRASAYSDYLFYLLYRNPGKYESELKEAVPLDRVPELRALISLPQTVLGATRYADVYAAAEPYRDAHSHVIDLAPPGTAEHRYRRLTHSPELPSFAQLQPILRGGEAAFPAFFKFWKDHIAPDEERQIARWREQDAACHPLDRLQQLARMRFPFAQLDVGAVALHLSGSANTDPPAVTTGVWSKPDLAWTLGHEGTHLLVDEHAGARWTEGERAITLVRKVDALGAHASDVEEALALLMQVKLSQSCGWTKPDFVLTAKMKDDGSLKWKVLAGLENDWPSYERTPSVNLVDFLIDSASRTVDAAPGTNPKSATVNSVVP